MGSDILLSLCIPTNGIAEWAIPVIDSIYAEKSPIGSFEIIVTDNGSNSEFAVLMHEYETRYDNFIYRQTEAVQFQNQIEAFKLAKGRLIKFVNHRMRLLPGTLNYLIRYVKDHIDEKPITYFSNGALKKFPKIVEIDTFDGYVKALSYYSSWSAGTAMWKLDFEKMDASKKFNKYFPHIDMIFFDKVSNSYIIDNNLLMEEIPVDDTKKGSYDLFGAFAYEYVKILDEIKNCGYITDDTFEKVRKDNENFIARLYYRYVFRHQPCSYNLSGFENAISFYYKKSDIYSQIPILILYSIIEKMNKLINHR